MSLPTSGCRSVEAIHPAWQRYASARRKVEEELLRFQLAFDLYEAR